MAAREVLVLQVRVRLLAPQLGFRAVPLPRLVPAAPAP